MKSLFKVLEMIQLGLTVCPFLGSTTSAMLSSLAVGGNLEQTEKMEKKDAVRLNECF